MDNNTPPIQHINRDDIPLHEIYAGFGIRALARLINMLVGFLLGIPAAIIMVIVLLFLGAKGTPDSWQPTHSWISFLLVIPFGFLYESIAQSIGGADIGKAICGLRVVNDKEEKANILQGIIRSFAMVVDGFFFGLIGLSSMNSSNKNQRYGDKWAKTLVIKRKYLNYKVKWGPIKMLTANLIGMLIWIAPMIIYDVNQILHR